MFIISRSLHGQICIPVSKFHCKQSTVSRSTSMQFVTADFNDLVRVTNFSSLSLSLSLEDYPASRKQAWLKEISRKIVRISEECRQGTNCSTRSVNPFVKYFLKHKSLILGINWTRIKLTSRPTFILFFLISFLRATKV